MDICRMATLHSTITTEKPTDGTVRPKMRSDAQHWSESQRVVAQKHIRTTLLPVITFQTVCTGLFRFTLELH